MLPPGVKGGRRYVGDFLNEGMGMTDGDRADSGGALGADGEAMVVKPPCSVYYVQNVSLHYKLVSPPTGLAYRFYFIFCYFHCDHFDNVFI